MWDIRIFIKVFDENENIYPVKPDHLNYRSRKHVVYFMLLVLLFLSISTSYNINTYILLLEVLVVLFLHELGHFIMMKLFNTKAQGMFFMTFLSKGVKSLKFSESQKEQTLINLMGPLPGLLIGMVLFMLVVNGEPNQYLIELAYLFIGINLLNLLPIDPFDGGRIIGGFFFNKNDRSKMIFALISSVLVIGLGVYFNFIPLIVFGFLMGLKVRGLQKSSALHENLEEGNVNYKKTYEDLSNREYWKIRTAFLRFNPKLAEMIPTGYTLWENERLLVEQVKQLLRVQTKPDLHFVWKVTIILVMVILSLIPVYLVVSHIEIFDWYLDKTNA